MKGKDPSCFFSFCHKIDWESSLGFIRNGMANKALELFNLIENPNEIILILLFNACAQLKTDSALNLVKDVSSQMSQSFYSNENLTNSLIDALIKCGDCSTAESHFSRSKKNVITYGNLMNGFNKEKNFQKTLNIFSQMLIDHIAPTPITYLCLINALSQLGFNSISQSFIEKMPKSFLSNVRIQTALIDMWVSYLKSFISSTLKNIVGQISLY